MSKTNKLKLQAIDKISNNIQKHIEQTRLINFNFKYYTHGSDYGESFEDWEEFGLLVDYNNKLTQFSTNTIEELHNSKILELYDSFPKGSKFKPPKAVKDLNICWARLRLTGKRRICGFFLKGDQAYANTMFNVFLDKDHCFAPCDTN